MEPLQFTKVLKEKVWGGREFEAFLGVTLPKDQPFGESWEVSAHPNGPSVVASGEWKGRSLPELVASEGERLVGHRVWNEYKGQFPLLIKYLDIHDKLSIQVHPDDEYALAREGEFGKSECWYVLSASPDARLIVGMAEGVTAAVFAERSARGQWDGLFHELPVTRGDFVHVTPGTVHASLTGSVLIAEIQQNSDTTYRIYDFDRLENGVARPLHLKQALEVIRFDSRPTVTHAATRTRRAQAGFVIEPLVRDPKYCVDRLDVTERFAAAPEDRFEVYSVLAGEGRFVHNGRDYAVKGGQTWLLPAGLAPDLRGRVEVLRSWV